MSYFDYLKHTRNCDECKLPIKNLTRYRSKIEHFCQCRPHNSNKYHFDTIIPGGSRIYGWTNQDKCFNIRDSNLIRCCLRTYIKKHGGNFAVRVHLAGMQVFNLAKIDIPKLLTTNEL
jgi:hypothetical protein